MRDTHMFGHLRAAIPVRCATCVYCGTGDWPCAATIVIADGEHVYDLDWCARWVGLDDNGYPVTYIEALQAQARAVKERKGE